MEINNYIFSLALALTLPVLVIVLYALKNNKKLNFPPGSFGWPVIGETIAFVNQDHGEFIGERMQKYSPKIFKTKILGEKAVVLCGTAGHKFISANEGKLFAVWRPRSMQRLFGMQIPKATSVAALREAELQTLKKPRFFGPESLSRYMQEVDTIVRRHLDAYWAGNDVVEVHRLAQRLVLTFACRFFAGLDDKARVEKLSELMDVMMFALHVVPLEFPGTVFYKAMRKAEEARKDLEKLVVEKKEAMARGAAMKDGLDFMIATPDADGQIMPKSIIANKVMGLLAGAFNSPALAISFIMKYLGEHPQICERVRSEQLEIAKSKKEGEVLNWEDIQKMKYSWNVALEVMRLTPPLQGTFRETITDISYEGYTIPKGWKVYWTVSTINMDSKHFTAPDEFDPTRYEKSPLPPYSNIPFGSGPRICPGMDFARLQILSFIHHLVTSFKWEVLNPNCKILGGMNPMPVDGLKVRLQSVDST